MEYTIEARGLRFRVVRWGTAGDDPILLLHGLFGPLETFELLVDTYEGERPLIAYDQRGHNGTAPTDGFTIPTFADDAAAIISQIGAPLDVVGHSMGAAVALTLAARHHGLVKRLILCEPPLDESPEGEVPRLIRNAPLCFSTLDAGIAYQMAIQSDLTPERAERRLRRVREGEWTWRVSIDGLRRLLAGKRFGALGGFEPWLDAPLINCPTLVIRGGDSRVFSDNSLRALTDAIPPAEGLTIAGVAHGVPYEKPLVLAGLMRGFMSQGG